MSNARKPGPPRTDGEVARVRVDANRWILVHVWRRGGKGYVRFRYWHRHLVRGVWYPDSHFWGPRAFVLPLDAADALAGALLDAVLAGLDAVPVTRSDGSNG